MYRCRAQALELLLYSRQASSANIREASKSTEWLRKGWIAEKPCPCATHKGKASHVQSCIRDNQEFSHHQGASHSQQGFRCISVSIQSCFSFSFGSAFKKCIINTLFGQEMSYCIKLDHAVLFLSLGGFAFKLFLRESASKNLAMKAITWKLEMHINFSKQLSLVKSQTL